MSFAADALPWIGPAGTILTVIGSVAVFLRAQARQSREARDAQAEQSRLNSENRAAQHAENLARLDRFDGRLEVLERNSQRQTEIMVSFARIEVRVDGHDTLFHEYAHRLSQIENREAGRRIAAKG